MPTYNPEPQLFRQVVQAVVSVDRPLIVVDMSTNDDVRTTCAAAGDLVRYHSYPEARGVSDCRNRCVEVSPTDRIVFLDADALPVGDWIRPLLERLDESDVAVAAARILPMWRGHAPWAFTGFTGGLMLSLLDLGPDPLEIPRVIGTSYAFDRTRAPTPAFRGELGRRPDWPLSGEENRLCVESRKMGYRVVYEPRAVVFHAVAGERLTWRWMLRRIHNAGRERRLVGPEEPFPAPKQGMADWALKAAGALPFYAGRVRGARLG